MIPECFRSHRQLLCAHATEALAPMLRMGSRWWSGSSTSPERWRKGLLIGANHIGDILYRTSSLMQLAKGFPDCTWDILAPEPAAQVLEANHAFRKIHRMEIPYYGSEDFMKLKQEQYDVAICYDSGSYSRPLLTATLLGIPNRVGYVHKGWSGLVTHPIRINYPQPFPAYFRDLVAQLTEQETNWDLRPKVTLTEQDHRKAEALWSELKLADDRPVLACFVTTRQPTGVWPLEKFRETLELLHSSSTAQIVLCGAAQDAEKLKLLQSSLSLPVSINAGRLELRALIAFLTKCHVVLSTDSGPRHLANAAGVPVVFVRNPWFSRMEAGVYCPDSEYDLGPDMEFLPPKEQNSHLDQATTKKVADLLLSLIT
ncbi:MAG: glycosyltransferase family 9 protein [Verrucomicrobia bacterium]|nr:glycosyltransferase family 9 protein [Verrucomicrobiota bacterium]